MTPNPNPSPELIEMVARTLYLRRHPSDYSCNDHYQWSLAKSGGYPDVQVCYDDASAILAILPSAIDESATPSPTAERRETVRLSIIRQISDNGPDLDKTKLSAADWNVVLASLDSTAPFEDSVAALSQTLPAPGEVELERRKAINTILARLLSDCTATASLDLQIIFGNSACDKILATVAAANDEGVAFVAGPIWQETEEEQECWTAEIQTVGGHNVIATVHGASRDEASQRQSAVMRALATSRSQREGASS